MITFIENDAVLEEDIVDMIHEFMEDCDLSHVVINVITSAYQNQELIIEALKRGDIILIETGFIGASARLLVELYDYIKKDESIRDILIVNMFDRTYGGKPVADIFETLREERNILYTPARCDDSIDLVNRYLGFDVTATNRVKP